MPAPSETSFFDHPFWGRGFRPFFMAGSLYAIISILLWAGVYSGHVVPPGIFADPVAWHAHEMIYGFAMAIVTGFLLTAVANWTGGAPVRQIQLLALCGLWIAGRIVMNFSGLPAALVLVAELSFIPALAISLSVPLLKSWNTRNFIFLGLLTILWVCDIVFMVNPDRLPLYIALVPVLMMISLIGGRIIPAFTVGALRRKGIDVRIHDQHKMDALALLSLAAVAVTLWVAGISSVFFAIACLVSAAIHLLRMRHYHTLRTFNDSMLWILHAGYGWLVVGLAMAGISGFGMVIFPVALHAITVGAIGSMTLGMMCRVTLGHTGRDLTSGMATTAAFLLMQLATVLRVFGPVIMPDHYTGWVVSSGILWAVCFAIYFVLYAPMLWQPRPDGKTA